jgi:DNA-binding HxlR family transcriptional regulator
MKNKTDYADCPVTEIIALFGGRWKVNILRVLSKHARRFGEISVRIPAISKKVLTEQLKELEADGLISRKQFEEFPRRVEYALTEYGESLCPLLAYIAAWKKEKV